MASFAAQAALRAKWSSLVEEHSIEVPPEVTSKVTSVVGWLKQVNTHIICFFSFCMEHDLNVSYMQSILKYTFIILWHFFKVTFILHVVKITLWYFITLLILWDLV